MRKFALLTGICLFILSFSFHPTFGPEPENLSFKAPGCPAIYADTPAPVLPTDPEETKAKYPQNYFRSPVRHAIRLSGTFGELRPNHFHSGIDIKSSNGGVGDPVFAVADGYVARIKVQAGGYGNALYIRHPNGYTSVYAHLDRFAPELAKYVLEKQYERHSFAVDIYPEAGQFSFKKGSEIGKMGNSGSSQGPHLHFEMRDTRTQKPVNPLLFGFPMTDNRAPRMHQLRVYALNDKRETVGAKTYNLLQKGRQYRVAGDTLIIDAWRAGFALKVYDHHDFVTNWNGIYQLEMRLNDQPWYAFDLESFSFNETRYVNAHLDYGELVSKKAYFNRCFRLPGNQLSIYSVNENEGVVPLHQNQTAKISLIASDVDGNESRLDFWVKRGEVTPAVSPPYNYLLLQNEENEIETGQLFVHFPRGALYENLYMEYAATPEKSYGYYSNVHHIHNKKTPVHRYFDLAIKPTRNIPPNAKSKAFIAYCDNDKVLNCGGKWVGDKLTAKVRALGDYCIMVDDVAPTITPISFQKNMKGRTRMSFKIKDNYEVGGKASGLRFKATVDGQWILLEHDAKKDLIIHNFDGHVAPGEHQLRLIVEDNRGNRTVYERTFVR